MFKSILLPTDGSPLADSAAAAAARFAQIHGARIVGVAVVTPLPFVPVGEAVVDPDPGMVDIQSRQAAKAALERLSTAADGAGVPFEGLLREANNPFEAIVKTAEERGCDIIVMASHDRSGLQKLFLGSETQKVLAHTHLPVLVLR